MSVFWTRQSWLKEQWLSLGPVQHQYLIRVLMRDMLNSHTRSHNDILIREFELQNSRKLGSDIVAEQALSYVSKTLSVLWVQLDNSRKEDCDVDFYEERRLWCEEMFDVSNQNHRFTEGWRSCATTLNKPDSEIVLWSFESNVGNSRSATIAAKSALE